MCIKIDFTPEDLTLIQEATDLPSTRSTPWLNTNLSCNLALYKLLNVDPKPRQLIKTPFTFKNNKRLQISIKSFSSETHYPEIKESEAHRPFDLYVLAVYNEKIKRVYFDGWAYYKELVQDKNLYKGAYILSYKDLNNMENFPK